MNAGMHKRIALIAVIVGLGIGAIGATTRSVPDSGTLQQVINVSQSGDVISITANMDYEDMVQVSCSGVLIEGNYHILRVSKSTELQVTGNYNTIQNLAIAPSIPVTNIVAGVSQISTTPVGNSFKYCDFWGNGFGTTAKLVAVAYDQSTKFDHCWFHDAKIDLASESSNDLQITNCVFVTCLTGIETTRYYCLLGHNTPTPACDTKIDYCNFKVGRYQNQQTQDIMCYNYHASGYPDNMLTCYVSNSNFIDTGNGNSYPIRLSDNEGAHIAPVTLYLKADVFYLCPNTNHLAWLRDSTFDTVNYNSLTFVSPCVAGGGNP
jgi:hypothetical protein